MALRRRKKNKRKSRIDILCPIPKRSGRPVKQSHNRLRDNDRRGLNTGCLKITVYNLNAPIDEKTGRKPVVAVYKCKSQAEYNRLMDRSSGIDSSMGRLQEWGELEKRVSHNPIIKIYHIDKPVYD